MNILMKIEVWLKSNVRVFDIMAFHLLQQKLILFTEEGTQNMLTNLIVTLAFVAKLIL